jgi:hypothetical protein
MAETEKRKVGRPRRYAPGKRPTLTFRVQEPLHRELTKAAKAAKRSISEEIEQRLSEYSARKAELERALDAARIQAIRQAGFNIVREAGGDVTVNVSPELLLAEADGILRSGFFAAEDVNKTPTEIMIERTLKRVLAEAGLMGGSK